MWSMTLHGVNTRLAQREVGRLRACVVVLFVVVAVSLIVKGSGRAWLDRPLLLQLYYHPLPTI